MKIQSNISWYKAISKVNPIFYKSSFNNPLTTIPPTIPPRIYRVRPYIGPRGYSGNYVTLQHQSNQFVPFWKVLNARDDISRRFHTKLR